MLDILAIGDAIVDKIISFDEKDPVMQSILSVKGLFFVASKEEHAYLREKETLSYYAGGSVANTVRSMSLMGFKTGFIGKAGDDLDGSYFEKSLSDYCVASYLLKTKKDKTGCSVVMVHSDKDRTQCARPCASLLLTADEVKDDYLKSTKSVMLEGYMISRLPKLVEDVILRAKKLGVKVYFTLSDVHCVEGQKELIIRLLSHIDILFGNEHEFEVLNLTPDMLKNTLCVKTCGDKGVCVFDFKEDVFFENKPVSSIVNTNGAGDAFAAGFLCAYMQNKPIKECVLCGHETAAIVLKTDLSYLPKDFVKKS